MRPSPLRSDNLLLWFGKKKIDKKVMDKLDAWGAQVYGEAYEYYYNMAKEENENVAKIFHDWWYGKCVTTEEYMSQFSEEDNRVAGNIIMTAISSGFG